MAGHQQDHVMEGFGFVRVSIFGESWLFTTVTIALDFLERVLHEDIENGSCGSVVDVAVVWLSNDEARQHYHESGEDDWGL